MKLTEGVNHVALTVRDLGRTLDFFTGVLGYELLGEDEEYPAAFVSDGKTMLTFWQAKEPSSAVAFDRHHVLGLHHLAITIAEGQLDELYRKLTAIEDCEVEFEPESMYGGPRRHMMVAVPGSGIRLECVEMSA